MGNITLSKPDSIKIYLKDFQTFCRFLQEMTNRFCIGNLRYGSANPSKRYLTRLKLELKAYEKSGNGENLINTANYCCLEMLAPEHPNHHFNPLVESATREFKGFKINANKNE